MSRVLAEQLARERASAARIRAAERLRASEARRLTSARRWHRVSDYARRRALAATD